jgi:FkbM family methyltransferase
MQKINDILLKLALHGRGFNNCCDSKSTGEEIFFTIYSRLKPKYSIDIGANKGDYTEKILSYTNSHVLAFEPLPKAYESLTKLQKKYPNRLSAINQGVGSEKARLPLYFGSDESELASFSSEVNEIDFVAASNTKTMMVLVDTLDNFLSEKIGLIEQIDLIKIDTEGFEYEVLLGAKKTIETLKPKFIQIEYNWHQLFRNKSLHQISKLLNSYRCFQMLPYGSGLIERKTNKPETNIFYYSNYIFVRNDINFDAYL